MTRAEFIALASPPCHECGAPVQRVESTFKFEGEDWVPNTMYMVCSNRHRVRVRPVWEAVA